MRSYCLQCPHDGDVMPAGPLVGHKIVGVRMVLEDGASHIVDSSENAFRQAAIGAIRTCKPIFLACLFQIWRACTRFSMLKITRQNGARNTV